MSLSYSKYVPHLLAIAVLGALPGVSDAQKIKAFADAITAFAARS